ncbi:MAG: VOC family protein, partial [Pseudonocardia sp.]|nr:VOC family protein [Pseudonocardia sp.]
MVLNHTIVPARDAEASARFFADIFGVRYDGPAGSFVAVQVNDDLTFDYSQTDHVEWHHYAFHVSEQEFDEIFGRVAAAGVPYGSGPHSLTDGQINHRLGGRGV